jgi:hypothetical protein
MRLKDMKTQDFDDETLMAYADNMLGPAETARIEKLVLSDPAVAAKVRMFQQTSSLTHAALAPLVNVPVPEALRAAVKGRISDHEARSGKLPPLKTRLQNRFAQWGFGLSLAAASSFAGLLGVIIGYQQAMLAPNHPQITFGVAPSASIVAALNTMNSGEETKVGDDKIRFVATFRNADQSLCRELEYASRTDGSIVAIACKKDETWKIQFAVISSPMETGYAPASSLEAVEAYMLAIGAGPALTIAEEDTALKAN